MADLVRRYLAAYGPASVLDAQTFTGLTGLREVFDGLRPELETFRDEAGGELFDLADAPRPMGRTRAPVRFLPEFDNILLSHARRERILPEGTMSLLSLGNGLKPAFLVDGFVAGTWRLRTDAPIGGRSRSRRSSRFRLPPGASSRTRAGGSWRSQHGALRRRSRSQSPRQDDRIPGGGGPGERYSRPPRKGARL